MMFFKKRCYCILCNKYMNAGKMYETHEGIGICTECHANIPTTKEKCFDGGKYIRAVLAPYMYKGKICDAVKDYKFNGQWSYGTLLGKLAAKELREHEWISDYDLIIPVPLYEHRMRERGFNQAEIFARAISRYINVPMYDDVLFRIKDTKRQSTLRGAERVTNVRDAFYAFGSVAAGKKIIIVDDVYTMGRTANECALALKRAGAENVIAISLCMNSIG